MQILSLPMSSHALKFPPVAVSKTFPELFSIIYWKIKVVCAVGNASYTVDGWLSMHKEIGLFAFPAVCSHNCQVKEF